MYARNEEDPESAVFRLTSFAVSWNMYTLLLFRPLS